MTRELLDSVSHSAINLGDFDFSPQEIQSKWLGRNSVSAEDIVRLEERWGVKLPSNYFEYIDS